MKTFFAPAECASLDYVRKQHAEVNSTLEMKLVGQSISDMITILNEHRQIVYAHPVMTRFVEKSNSGDMCSMRPGELFGCVHAQKLAGGCGTSQLCRFCAAGTAIVDALSGEKDFSKECMVSW